MTDRQVEVKPGETRTPQRGSKTQLMDKMKRRRRRRENPQAGVQQGGAGAGAGEDTLRTPGGQVERFV